jgi:hypothetical protein
MEASIFFEKIAFADASRGKILLTPMLTGGKEAKNSHLLNVCLAGWGS